MEKKNTPITEEQYVPLPPEQSNNYMSNLRQQERSERLKAYEDIINTANCERAKTKDKPK